MKRSESRKAPRQRPDPLGRKTALSRNGFTLLEVLAAVAILGIWYTVMATIAIQGLRAEGQSQRRLRASLLADEIVADLEANIALQHPPPFEEDEVTRGEFTVLTSIQPYDLKLPASTDSTGAGNQSQTALEQLAGLGGKSPLSQIQVKVTWIDGIEERSVIRETFGLDIGPSMAALLAATPKVVVESESTKEEPPKNTVDSVVTFPEDDAS